MKQHDKTPSPEKVNERLEGWRAWARKMAFLRAIHAELKDKLDKARATHEFILS